VTGQPVEPAAAQAQAPYGAQPAAPAGAYTYAAPTTAGLGPGGDPVTGLRLASWGRRLGGFLIDFLVLIALFIPVIVYAGATSDPDTGEIDDGPAAILVLTILLVPFLYPWLMLGLRGATLGKLAVGIVVVRAEDGQRFGLLRALGRVLSVSLLGLITIPLLLSYLWPLWDRRNQTLHDKMASTIVVVESP
jgi:uncharacterized RDD family membrane protein YckC